MKLLSMGYFNDKNGVKTARITVLYKSDRSLTGFDVDTVFCPADHVKGDPKFNSIVEIERTPNGRFVLGVTFSN